MAISIYSRPFWKSTGERALKTLLQTSAGVIPTIFVADAAGVIAFVGVPWPVLCSVVLIPTALSVITSLLGGLNGTGPSFVDSEIKADAVVLDEVEINAVEAQKILDQMVIEGEVPDQDSPLDDDSEDGLDAEPEGNADDEIPVIELPVSDDEGDAEPEGLSDDEELAATEVDDTPPPEDYRPRH